MYDCYSVNQIKEIINIGKTVKNNGGSYYDLVDAVEEKYNYQNAGLLASIGYEKETDGIDFEIRDYYRIGEPQLDFGGRYKPSYNFADEKFEAGVSVITSAWLHSLKSVFFGVSDEKIQRKGLYKIKGIKISTGGDDEAVIYPMGYAEKTKIRTYNGMVKAVKESENR